MELTPPRISIVVPTIGRPSLAALLESIARTARSSGISPPPITLVDDRAESTPLPVDGSAVDGPADLTVHVLKSGARGPAAARNVGWRSSNARWIAFLDDDVVVGDQWIAELYDDIARADADVTRADDDIARADNATERVGGVSSRITVPLPAHRRPTDAERGTAGLETARWITADMVYLREALQSVNGFDERFPRAFREDSDLALRVLDRGYRLVDGKRRTSHPVRPARWWASVAAQRGNADDVLMRRVHGRTWRQRAQAPLGRRPQHLLCTAFGVTAIAAGLGGRRRLAGLGALAWLAGTAEFASRRIAPGPRDGAEVGRMLTTSVAIPPAATYFWLRAVLRPRPVRGPLPDAVLVDRDGTIVKDVPYNADPSLVQPMPGARTALDRLRQAGIPVAVISNQSGIGRGLLTSESVAAVNARVEQLLGPFEGWFVCPHVAEDGCDCRKPQPGLIHQAAQRLGVQPHRCVVIGDIGSDVGSAAAAGARSILVPTEETLPDEVLAAPVLARNIGAAVDLVLTGEC